MCDEQHARFSGSSSHFFLTSAGTDDEIQNAADWVEYCNGDVSTTWGALRAARGHPEPYGIKHWFANGNSLAAAKADWRSVHR